MREKIKYYLGGGGWKLIPILILVSPILIIISPALIYDWLKEDHKKIAAVIEATCIIYLIIYFLYIFAINLHYIMQTMFKYKYFSLVTLIIILVYILDKSSLKKL